MLKLFNTLSREKEEFKPISVDQVGLYTCGPTVYDYQHIGNLRTFFFEDILKRVLIYNGYRVKHVMNITDVGHLVSDEDEGEDKMELGAEREGKSVREIADHFTDAFMKDSQRMNFIAPDIYCKATDFIKEQIDLVKCLEEKGYAYITSDGVYFDTSKFPDYGKLARLDIEGLKKGIRIEFSAEKKNITDFALWKFSPAGKQRQMEWDSPWGKGFPGWHLECSAMSKKFLGDHFDIHCGGIDHIPVHHTNEIAQSEACSGEKFVNYWLHGEFLIEDSGKMSKSKGEFLTLQALIDKDYDPMHYRYYLLNTHYRKKLNFSFDGLDTARNGYENLKGKILRLKAEAGEKNPEMDEAYNGKFLETVNDDINTPEALAVLWNVLKDDNISAQKKLGTAYEFDRIFGLKITGMKDESGQVIIPGEVIILIDRRTEAKQKKDFKTADELRKKIEEMGFELLDKKEGVEVKKISSTP
jgi:cysteinyl-tRNA synthetase